MSAADASPLLPSIHHLTDFGCFFVCSREELTPLTSALGDLDTGGGGECRESEGGGSTRALPLAKTGAMTGVGNGSGAGGGGSAAGSSLELAASKPEIHLDSHSHGHSNNNGGNIRKRAGPP